MVDGHRQRRTQTAACFTNAFELHRQIKVGFGQEVCPAPPGCQGFKFQAIAHATGVVFQRISRAVVPGSSSDAVVFHAAGEAHQLGTGIFA